MSPIEFGRGKTAPRVRRQRRRARAAVHVVRVVDRTQPFGVIRGDLYASSDRFLSRCAPATARARCTWRRGAGTAIPEACTARRSTPARASDPALLIGMPRNSPTYGLPVLSSSCTGAHSPEKSICANAGRLTASAASRLSADRDSPCVCHVFTPVTSNLDPNLVVASLPRMHTSRASCMTRGGLSSTWT